MKTLKDFLAVVEFLGMDMTDEHVCDLLGRAKEALTTEEISILGNASLFHNGKLYGPCREYQAECGNYYR